MLTMPLFSKMWAKLYAVIYRSALINGRLPEPETAHCDAPDCGSPRTVVIPSSAAPGRSGCGSRSTTGWNDRAATCVSLLSEVNEPAG
jgi:hypothetical protein